MQKIPRDAGEDPQTGHPSGPGRILQVVPGALLGSASIPPLHPKHPAAAQRPPCPLLAQGTRTHVRTRRRGAGGEARLQE